MIFSETSPPPRPNFHKTEIFLVKCDWNVEMRMIHVKFVWFNKFLVEMLSSLFSPLFNPILLSSDALCNAYSLLLTESFILDLFVSAEGIPIQGPSITSEWTHHYAAASSNHKAYASFQWSSMVMWVDLYASRALHSICSHVCFHTSFSIGHSLISNFWCLQ